jgi:hypothetical protein
MKAPSGTWTEPSFAERSTPVKEHNAGVICLALRRYSIIHSLLKPAVLNEEKSPHAA